MGNTAGSSNTTGFNNTFIGATAGANNVTGNQNVFVGDGAGTSNTASSNTFVGYASGNTNTSGTSNTANGWESLLSNTTGSNNTAFGYGALPSNTIGNVNTAVGTNALYTNTTGSSNTGLGYQSGYLNSTGTGNVFLGYKAGYNETGSNKLYIANSASNPPLIYGDFTAGMVGIGTISPTALLHVYSAGGVSSILSESAANDARVDITTPLGHYATLSLNEATGGYFASVSVVSSKLFIQDGLGVPTMTFTGKKVGIGNQNPGSDLSIIGGGSTNATSALNIVNSGGTNMLFVRNDGNVGIGTAAPAFQFHINNTNSATTIAEIDGSANNYAGMYINANGGAAGLPFYGYKVQGTGEGWTAMNNVGTFEIFNTNQNFTMLSSGNVGIGLTAPAQKLDVNGNVQVPAANDYLYSTPKTLYYSVPSAAFLPEADGTYQRAMITGNSYLATGTATVVGYMDAPVNLPDGATVLSVTFFVVDNDGTYNLQPGQLWRNDASTATSYGNVVQMANVPIPGNSNSTLVQSTTTNAITNPVIDNQNYMYYLRWGTQQANANMRIVKVLITYTVTKAN